MALDHDRTRALSALAAIDPGCDRETWVRIGMAAKASGLGFSDFLAWSEQAGNFKSEQDCRAVWKSIKPAGGVGPGTLFALAKDAGWHDDTGGAQPAREVRTKVNGKAAKHVPAQQKHDAGAIWAACEHATPRHEYIERKLGLHGDVRVYRGSLKISGRSCDGALVLPVQTLSGDLATLQFILKGDCSKVFLPGVSLPPDGCLIVGGPISDAERIHIVEGIGQAWSAYQATQAPAVCTFGASRMASVTKAVRTAICDAELVLVADRGKEPQCAEIAAGLDRCAWVELPQDRPANFDLNDYHKEVRNLRAVAELLAQIKRPPQRFAILTADELAALPPLRWRVKRVFPDRGVAVVFGASGSGKTFLVLDFAEHIASGRAWFGYQTTPCAVVYVGLEGTAGLSQRVQAYRAHHDGDAAQGMHFIIQPVDLLATGDVSDLATAIRGTGAGVVIIDTLNAAAPGADENASQDMGRVIAAAKALQDAVGGLVVLVHHSGKDAARGLRGHSSLFAAMDAVLEVVRDGARREWKLSKSKDGADGQAHPFRLVVVPLGTDDDGDPITSCVIEPDDTPADGVRRAALPGGGNMRLAWDAIGDLLKRSTNQGMASAPPGRPCVTLEEAIAAAAPRLPCEAKRQRERAQQAVTGLVGRGNLAHADGWVWLP